MTCDDFINYDRTSAQTLVTASRGRAEVILQTLNHLAHHRILVFSHSKFPRHPESLQKLACSYYISCFQSFSEDPPEEVSLQTQYNAVGEIK